MEADRTTLSESELVANTERLSESEFLDEQSRVASDALARLRGEVVDSLRRTADPVAWTVRYPLQSLAAAAAAGLGAGIAMGRATGRKEEEKTANRADETDQASEEQRHEAKAAPSGAWATLVGGLGTLLGAAASTVGVAATRAVAEIVRETIHDSIRTREEPQVNGQPEGE